MPMGPGEEALSDVMAEILILALVLALAAVIIVMVLGVMPLIPKTAYLKTEITKVTVTSYSAIAIRSLGGDPLVFTQPATEGYLADIFVDTPDGTFAAAPVTDPLGLKAGGTVYVMYSGTGYVLTDSPGSVTASALPSQDLRVRIVDAGSSLLIAEWQTAGFTTTAATAAVPTTALATPNVTANVTTSATANVTATITTVQTTIVPTVNVTANVTPTATITATPTATATANATATATANVTATATITATTTATTTAIPTTTTTVATTVTTTTPNPAVKSVTVLLTPAGLGDATLLPSTAVASGQVLTVSTGSSVSLRFTPRVNKYVQWIKLDGATVYTGTSVGSSVTYTIPSIAADHTLEAHFSQ